MVEWPLKYQSLFFSEIQNLSDEQSNTLIVEFSLRICCLQGLDFYEVFLNRSKGDVSRLKYDLITLGESYWSILDNKVPEKTFLHKFGGYVFWAVREHYDADGAMEILDDMIDDILETGEDYEKVFGLLFATIAAVRTDVKNTNHLTKP